MRDLKSVLMIRWSIIYFLRVFYVVCLFNVPRAGGQTVYVVPSDTVGLASESPFDTWAKATTNIQLAINTAFSNTWTNVVVSNGIYNLSYTVSIAGIADPVQLRSWNDGMLDPAGTILDRGGTGRAVLISNAPNAVVDGFTVRGGNRTSSGFHGQGAGIWIDSGVVRNCIVVENTATSGGGIFTRGGMVETCSIYSNEVSFGGGGIYMNVDSIVDRCQVFQNTGPNGAGLFMLGGQIFNSVIRQNIGNDGGGINFRYGWVQNCNIVSNYAGRGGGTYNVSTVNDANFINNIVYYNASPNGANHYTPANSRWTNNCSPVALNDYGANNITAEPLFVSFKPGMDDSEYNFRLQKDSPCIDAGMNLEWMNNALDLAGRPRLDRFYRLVDMGCYENTILSGIMFGVR